MTPGQSPGSPNDGNALEQSMFKKALNDSIRDGLGPVRPIKLRIVRSTVDKSRRVPTSAGDCRGVSGCRGVGSTGRCRGRTDGSPRFGVLEPAAISRHWGESRQTTRTCCVSHRTSRTDRFLQPRLRASRWCPMGDATGADVGAEPAQSRRRQSCRTGAANGRISFAPQARVAELADAGGLNLLVRKDVWVRIPPRAHGVSWADASGRL